MSTYFLRPANGEILNGRVHVMVDCIASDNTTIDIYQIDLEASDANWMISLPHEVNKRCPLASCCAKDCVFVFSGISVG